nr:hypothetical protein BaRGS_006137 [Batillaria attramentaria]
MHNNSVQEADLAVSLFTLTRERSVVADPTSAVIYDNAVIIFKTASRSLDDWSFLQPFQTPVYVAIISCFVSVLVLLLLFEKCQWTLGDHQDEPTGVVAILQWIAMDFEILLAGVLNRPFTELSESRAGRVLVCAWLLLGVVIASVYSSKLTSSLTMGEQALPFTSMAQLLGRGDYTWGVNSGTAQELLLKTSSNKEYQEFYRGVLRFAQSDPGVTSSDYSVHKRKVIEGQYAYFSGTGELYRACYTLTLHPHNLTWGQELDNGSWDGPIGMLTRKPFQTPVYVAIGGSFVSVLILLLLLEKSVVHEIKARAGYVLMWAWLMFGVVLASVYSSKLTSSLTVRDQTLPFTSLSQLVNQDTYTWGVARGVYLESVLKRFAKTDPAVFSSDFGVHKSKVLGGRYAFFTIAGGLYELWSQETHNLARIPENYMTNGYVFYLQKESPYTEMVSAE